MLVFACAAACAAAFATIDPLPELVVTRDDTVITRSCRIVIATGIVIADASNDGVLRVDADDVVVEFAPGTVLRGAAATAAPDQLAGIGVAVDGHSNVTLRGLDVSGFKVGVLARRSPGLRIDGASIHDCYRQPLHSMPSAEDSSDWLWPHKNDEHEWRTNYGAAVCVEDSDQIDVRNVTVRRGQNGIILDRVNRSRVYDNDCSFLSGWGVGVWRSSRNMVSRNAADFCIRGHSEGVYNRGQDSAGFLVFEQCSGNTFAENSATHCGDGFFCFAGKEALGEVPPRAGTAVDYARVGCDDNVIIGNDFSDSAAHGLELTFGHGNQILRNWLTDNAICGLWGGYSQETLIAENTFKDNGGMAYGKERGGINIEHGSLNRIVANTFINNKCAIRLWWDDDGALLKLPGVKTSYRGVTGNVINANTFTVNAAQTFHSARDAELQFRVLEIDTAPGGRVADNAYFGNTVSLDLPNAAEVVAAPSEPVLEGVPEGYRLPPPTFAGEKHPVSARSALNGRGEIQMGPWGPWDHEAPMVRLAARTPNGVVYEMFGGEKWSIHAADERIDAETAPGLWPRSLRLLVRALPGIVPYSYTLRSGEFEETVSGTMVTASWAVTFFPWTIDPPTDYEGWKAEGSGPGVVSLPAQAIDFAFNNEGPAKLLPPEIKSTNPAAAALPADHFGVLARTTLDMPKGSWRFKTMSDDGVRVRVGGKVVIDNWTWHGPTENIGVYEQATQGPVDIEVEYFELDGFAVLRLAIEPVASDVAK